MVPRCTCYSFTCLCSNCDDLPEPLADPIQDPSGFVYEGSESQRIEGVTATLYQKTISEDSMGDSQEVVAVWDAARYGQSNPVITDAEGYYRWDVPEGLWQVKFEKEGYETVTTDGSDPTELSDNVTLYDGLPIRIEHDMVIRAVAMADNMTDSEVVSFRFIVSTSGVENVAVDTSEISVSPIPMRDMINIQTRGRSILGVHIFDMRGARLISRNFSNHPSEVSVETATLPKGIYLIVVETDFGKSCLRTIKV